MNNSWRRQPLLALAAAVAVAATLFIANAGGQATVGPPARWVGTWAAAQTAAALHGPAATGFTNQTLRMIVHTSVAGEQVRIRLSNVFGTKSLTIGHATIGRPAGGAAIQAGSGRDIMFNGRATVTLPRGVEMRSDPVVMDLPAMVDLAVSLWIPLDSGPATYHSTSRETTYLGAGDHASDELPSAFRDTVASWFYLSGVDVLTRHARGSVVVLGDSISDGFGAKIDANHRFPDDLAQRLAVLPESRAAPGVLNLSLTGNAYSHDGVSIKFPNTGVSALARLDRDVFSQTAVRAVIVELGINDIWIYQDSPDVIITQMRQVAVRAHEEGLRVLVCTLMPWKGYTAWTPVLEATRLSVNDYIRSTKDYDAVVDADKALRDPAQPAQLRPEWDSGDHIHPNDAGLLALAATVPLDLLVS